MTSIKTQGQEQERQQAHRLKQKIKRLIHDELKSINPWWFISFHYRDHHSKEDELLQDVADLKRKLCRIIYKSRDKSIKGAGEYPYPKMLFFSRNQPPRHRSISHSPHHRKDANEPKYSI